MKWTSDTVIECAGCGTRSTVGEACRAGWVSPTSITSAVPMGNYCPDCRAMDTEAGEYDYIPIEPPCDNVGASFEEALEAARERYPHPINHFVEYRDYFVFEYDDGSQHDGGTQTPIVIRKSDMAALCFNPFFFLGLNADAEDAGEILREGEVRNGERIVKG